MAHEVAVIPISADLSAHCGGVFLTKPAVAANAVADSGDTTRMSQATAIMVASDTFLIWAEPDERAENCAI